MLGKTPGGVTGGGVGGPAAEKRKHNNEIIHKFYNDVQDRGVGVLPKKNTPDKGSRVKLSRGTHDVVGPGGYNFKLGGDRVHPPKDTQILK